MNPLIAVIIGFADQYEIVVTMLKSNNFND